MQSWMGVWKLGEISARRFIHPWWSGEHSEPWVDELPIQSFSFPIRNMNLAPILSSTRAVCRQSMDWETNPNLLPNPESTTCSHVMQLPASVSTFVKRVQFSSRKAGMRIKRDKRTCFI